jgi:hypothetical protein
MNYMIDVADLKRTYKEAHGALHRCWTNAVGTPDYHKPDFRLLENTLDRLARAVAESFGYKGPLMP